MTTPTEQYQPVAAKDVREGDEYLRDDGEWYILTPSQLALAAYKTWTGIQFRRRVPQPETAQPEESAAREAKGDFDYIEASEVQEGDEDCVNEGQWNYIGRERAKMIKQNLFRYSSSRWQFRRRSILPPTPTPAASPDETPVCPECGISVYYKTEHLDGRIGYRCQLSPTPTPAGEQATPHCNEVPCTHEWYQGKCVHCTRTPIEVHSIRVLNEDRELLYKRLLSARKERDEAETQRDYWGGIVARMQVVINDENNWRDTMPLDSEFLVEAAQLQEAYASVRAQRDDATAKLAEVERERDRGERVTASLSDKVRVLQTENAELEKCRNGQIRAEAQLSASQAEVQKLEKERAEWKAKWESVYTAHREYISKLRDILQIPVGVGMNDGARAFKESEQQAGHLFGRIGLLAREYMGISDNAPTSECIDAIQTALAALKLRADRIDRAVDADIVTLLERFQSGEATLLFTAQAIDLKLTADLATLRRDGERLDWLDSLPDDSEFTPSEHGKTIREAIDAAQQPPAQEDKPTTAEAVEKLTI